MNRCKQFMQALAGRGGQAALISRRENMRYLTGYTGEGHLFVAGGVATILTDFRYTEQAERQAPECACVRVRSGVTPQQGVKALMEENGLSSLSVETDFISHDEYARWADALGGVELKPLGDLLVGQLRILKDADEAAAIFRAAKIACEAYDYILGFVKPGMTEREVQIALDYKMLSLGSEQNAFDTIACAGANGSLPHAIPSDYAIRPGDLVTLDFGAQVDGYKCDMTRTFGVGKIREELKDVYQTVLDAQLAALEAIRPGAVCKSIDKVARDIIDAKYPGAFGHSLGHGVGLFIHELPSLHGACETVLAPGHVVTIEPGVYIPGLGGCRIEDMAIITETGFDNPITAPKQLIEL